MKKKRLFKKLLGMSLAMILLVTMAIPVLAEDSAPPVLKSTSAWKGGTDISFSFNVSAETTTIEEVSQWISKVTAVKLGDTTLKASQYKFSTVNTDKTKSASITFVRTDEEPVFTDSDVKSVNGRESAYDLIISADGYSDLNTVLTLKDGAAKEFTIRVVDGDGEIHPIKTFTWDELESLKQSGDAYYNTICGMAGVRTFKAEGVLLKDLFEKAGVKFGPKMELQVRTWDSEAGKDYYYGNGRFTYDKIMGKTRYYFPGLYTDVVLKDTVLANKNLSLETRTALAKDQSKVAVEPMIGLRYVETVYKSDQNSPASTPYSSLLSDEKACRFLFGLELNDDGTQVVEETTTFSATYYAFGVDIIDPDYTPPYVSEDTTGVKLSADSGVLPKGTTANIQKISTGDSYEKAKSALSEIADSLTLFDISLLDSSNKKVQPNGNVKVSLPIPAGYDKNRLAIYYIKDDGSIEKIEGTVEGEYCVFETSHFSLYSLVETKAETPVVIDNGTDVPAPAAVPVSTVAADAVKTGDNTHFSWLVVALIAAGAVIIFAGAVLAKKRKTT